MNIMADRETVVSDINKFISQQTLENAVVLLEHLCEVKEINKDETIKAVIANPMVLSMIMPNVLIELERTLKINRITDKNNILITVF